MSQLLEKKIDLLQVRVYTSRADMGAAACKDVVSRIHALLSQQETVRMIFAAAPSQLELLAGLAADQTIPWQQIEAFHMDEYIGLPLGAPQRFSSFLTTHLFEKVKPRSVHLIDDRQGWAHAYLTYTKLLDEAPVDIVCLGIGENGHIAFNDPPVADFNDPETIKAVTLDNMCRQQQVNDGCFPTFDDVPLQALTLTIPALLSGRYLYCVVPGKTKSEAVKNVVEGGISTDCPASVLRTHPNCMMYTDTDAWSRVS